MLPSVMTAFPRGRVSVVRCSVVTVAPERSASSYGRADGSRLTSRSLMLAGGALWLACSLPPQLAPTTGAAPASTSAHARHGPGLRPPASPTPGIIAPPGPRLAAGRRAAHLVTTGPGATP